MIPLPHARLLPFAAATLSLVSLYATFRSSNMDDDELKIPKKRAFWYIGTPDFFWNPFRFLTESRRWAGESMFAFRVLSNTVIVLRGLPGRDAFFSKGVDFMSGYRLLDPQLVDVMPVSEISGDESWASFMAATFIRSDALERVYPIMLQDVSNILDTWGDKGILNPFENVHQLVFVLAVRITACTEFSNDPKKIKKLMKIFDRLENGSTPSSIIFPWIPTPSRVGRLVAGGQLYSMIRDVVESRKREDRREDDPLQVLIDKDLTLIEITRFIAMTLFAAITNTGNITCWLLICLEVNLEWKHRVRGEIETFVRKNIDRSSSDVARSIADTPTTVLEGATQSLDLCINETLRVILTGTLMRRNIGEDIVVSGTRIKSGSFLMYPAADLHYNPNFYPEPGTFDPMRFSPEALEERRKHGITFLGWGASRHICVGKRTAVLMMKVILLLIIGNYDTDMVDTAGNPPRAIPEPHQDRLFKLCPPEDRILMKYQRKVIA